MTNKNKYNQKKKDKISHGAHTPYIIKYNLLARLDVKVLFPNNEMGIHFSSGDHRVFIENIAKEAMMKVDQDYEYSRRE